MAAVKYKDLDGETFTLKDGLSQEDAETLLRGIEAIDPDVAAWVE